jgi:hypothetical protein
MPMLGEESEFCRASACRQAILAANSLAIAV